MAKRGIGAMSFASRQAVSFASRQAVSFASRQAVSFASRQAVSFASRQAVSGSFLVVAPAVVLASCTAILGVGDLTFRDPDAGAGGGVADAGCGSDADPKNCGACGHDCQGGACTAGLCQPVVLASGQASPLDLALFGDTVYWTDWGVSNGMPNAPPNMGTGAVMQVSKSGGAPTPIALSQDGAQSIAVDETGIFWDTTVMGGGVFTCPLFGCSGPPLVLASSMYFPIGLALDPERAYWGSGMAVYARPKDGGAAPAMLFGSTAYIEDVAVDDGGVFWAEVAKGGIKHGPKTGGVPGAKLFQTGNDDYILRLALDGTDIYWTSFDDDILDAGADVDGAGTKLETMAENADGGVASTLATSPLPSVAIALDAANVFVVVGDGIVSVTKAGGTQRTLATGQTSVTAIAVDDRTVYWTLAGSRTTADGAVMKVAR